MGLAETIASACRTRFNTKVAAPNALTVQYDNHELAPPETSVWSRFHVLIGPIDRVQNGSPATYRATGLAQADFLALIESGTKTILDLADTTSNAFRSAHQGGVTFRSPSLSEMRREERWWVLSVFCPFFADEVV